ncbi:cytochrome P450 [Devosia algicola]|uniref:Cytochrome P450 n=1 Tax=Devosia algicola TaxID=3026418 RepID=A0ABY7YKF9_9HYPH|nr:cytochrome P450 [Devosia algicola]WDR01776.1 cytochrome P450 [Devosia algicola]
MNQDLAAFRAIVCEHLPNADSGILAHFRDHGSHGLSNTQIVDACILLFADGVENVASAIGTVMLTLTEHPEIRAALIEGKMKLGAVIEEALRRDAPGQIISRIVRRDTELAGLAVPAETAVFLLLGSANHDETVFADPERFDCQRDLEPMLTFGGGRHSCIGAQLARSQISAAVNALLGADIEIVTRPGQVRYVPRFGHRWPQFLEARIAPNRRRQPS